MLGLRIETGQSGKIKKLYNQCNQLVYKSFLDKPIKNKILSLSYESAGPTLIRKIKAVKDNSSFQFNLYSILVPSEKTCVGSILNKYHNFLIDSDP